MADEQKTKLDDGGILQIIDYGIGQSVGFSESKLSKERERVQYYYDGERPRKAHAGDSGYMSLDVFDGVEGMKAQLLDVFAANARPVSFNPVNGEDVAAAVIRTDYVTDVIFNQNPGYQLFQDTIELGLLNRNGVCKVWWETSEKTEHLEMADTTLEEVQAWLTQNPGAEIKKVELHEDGVTIERAQIALRKDTSQVRIKLLAGEEFGISPMAVDIPTAELVFHREEKTASELIKAGYDQAVVESLQDNDRLWMAMEPEKIARFQQTDDMIGTHVLEDGQAARKICMVYECYLELDMEGAGVSQLYKVTKVGDTILDKEPVDRKPFQSFCPLPRPKAFWGQNYAEKLIHTQTAKSYLTRSIVNHALTTNNPRMLVRKGALLNPRELMENRFGGIVNVTDPMGIVPLPQAGLNPFVFQTISLLDQQKEQQTGLSDLSQGLNHDAISKQNSGDMIHELISVSQLRQKIVARNFAENFLRGLYTEVYLLVLENEKRSKIAYIAGGWSPVDPSQWPEDFTMSVSFALGYGEQEKEAQKWMEMHAGLVQVAALAGNYGPAQQYAVVRKAIEAKGVKDIDNYLLPMNKAQPPPPNPMHMADVAMKQADAAAKNASAQATLTAAQFQMAKLQSEERIALAKINLETLKVQSDIQLKQDALAHKVAVDAAEVQLQVEAQASDKLAAEAQPTR